MKSLSIKVNNGNAGTVATYDEKKSSIFWSEQSSYSCNSEINPFVVNESDNNSFDKNLSALLRVPKPSSKKSK